MLSDDETAAPPEGFRELRMEGGFIGHNGPFFIRREEDDLAFGFRVAAHHCNPFGTCHGGWIASAMDMVLPLTARLRGGLENNFLFTVSMTLDYLGAANLGDWVEGRGEILRLTGRMVFVQGILTIDGDPCARGSGVFRRGPEGAPAIF